MDQSEEHILWEIEMHQLHMASAREIAEELVRDRGWSEGDEDFEFQIEQEARLQWEEELERQCEEHLLREAATCAFLEEEVASTL